MSESGAKSRTLLFLAGGLLAALAILLAVIWLQHRSRLHDDRQARRSEIAAGQQVQVAVAGLSPPERSIVLSGEARPYAEVTLYAKISGFLKRITVDKGDRVGRGVVIAVLESPEVDSQYGAALADARNKRVVARRANELLKSDSIARQDAENAEAAARIAEENASSLKTQKGYEIIRAPFDGTVTARFVDPGALVQSASNAQTSAQPLVTVTDTDRLRVYVYLDQKNAAHIRIGDQAEISDAARPDIRTPGRVSRISGALDPKTRTMLIELDLDNRSGRILANGFVRVALTIKTPPLAQIPEAALLIRGDTNLVALVDNRNRVRFRPVAVADTDGKAARIGSGLAAGDRVVLYPGTGITDGQLVRPVASQGTDPPAR